jgi:hypothetical protein
LANFTESQGGANLVIICRVVALDNSEQLAHILLHVAVVLGDDDGSDLGGGSRGERHLADQIVDLLLANDAAFLRFDE